MKSDQFTYISTTDAISLANDRIALNIYAGLRGNYDCWIDYFDFSFNAIEHIYYKL